jgi:hypothetical protein
VGLLAYKAGYVWTLLLLVTGCATFDQRAGFSDVSTVVEARSGKRVVWYRGSELDTQVDQEVRALLHDTLTVDGAVQVALLNNRTLQALYAELGVAQADLVQAGLLRNPVFDGAVRFLLSGGGPAKVDLSAALDFLDIFYLPLRKRVASALFEAAKLQVTGAVLDFAATVQGAFYRHQANEQRLELLQTVSHALAASFDVTKRLHEAGNISDLDLARERAQVEEAKVQLRAAEVTVRESQAQLNTVMGLWGEETAWRIDRRLPDIPAQPLPFEGLERQALRQSLDLASAGSGWSWKVNRWASLERPCSSLSHPWGRARNVRKVSGKSDPPSSFPSPSSIRDKGDLDVPWRSSAEPSKNITRWGCGFARRPVWCKSGSKGPRTARATTETSCYRSGSASSTRRSCTITPCNSASLSSYGLGSSRFRPPSSTSTRFSTTGWPAPTLSSS